MTTALTALLWLIVAFLGLGLAIGLGIVVAVLVSFWRVR